MSDWPGRTDVLSSIAAAATPAPSRRALNARTGQLLALAAGLAAALAQPPFGFLPGIMGYGLLLYVLDAAPTDRPLRAAFFRGWMAGFGYLLVSVWWIAEAFLVDAANRGWQGPFAVAFTAGGIGLFWGGAGLVYTALAPRTFGVGARVLVFAAALSLFEWLRGHVLSGFPWDLPGETWRAGSALSQTASLVGAYGLTFITVAIGASVVVLAPFPSHFSSAFLGLVPRTELSSASAPDGAQAPRQRKTRPSGQARGKRNLWSVSVVPLALALATLASLWTFGAYRLSQPPPPDTAVRVRIVQPGLGEEATWTTPMLVARYQRFMDLTSQPARPTPDVVVWPEGAIPYTFNDYLARGTWTLDALERALRPGQILLAGGLRTAPGPGGALYYNTLLALRRTPDGVAALASYDKFRLVPFGEFVPLAPLFARVGLGPLVQVGEPFTPGPRPAPIVVDGLPRVQPLICYEILFPGLATERGGRAAWIVNVSDDAWFGRTSGPLQHLNMAGYRAIEQGLPIVRSTPTGVSAIIDGDGRTRASLGLGQAGVIDARLPAALPPTLYSRWGDLPVLAAMAVVLLAAIAGRLTSGVRLRQGHTV
jgi:apolipoprotein N-acyltransferase